MKRTWVFVGLTLMAAGLAGGSMSRVFGQPDPQRLSHSPPTVNSTTIQVLPSPAPVPPGTPGPTPMPAQSPPYSSSPPLPPPSLSPVPIPGVGQPGVSNPPQPISGTTGQGTLPDRVPQHSDSNPGTVQEPQQFLPENPGSGANSENPSGRQEPAVSIEWIGPATARLNQPTSYQIIAKNISNAPVSNVVVRHRIPAGVKISGSEPKAINDGSVMTWELGTLMPGQDRRIDLQVIPEAKMALNCQAYVTFTGSSTLKVTVREPKLVLKATAQDKVVLGDTGTISLTVSNPGDGAADHVKLKALLPEGLEHARGKLIEVDLGSLAPGENRTVQLVCLTKNAGWQAIDCVALADAGLSAQDSAKLEVVLPRLDLVVQGPRLRYLERPATYTLKVTNPGSAPASNVSIVHQLSQGFKFQAASNGGRHDFTTRSVSWFIGDLTPGESREVTLDVIAINIGEHKHVAMATAARGLKTECEVMTRVEGLSALLMELVDTNDPVEVGAETTYEIRVTNTGSKTETNLELVCTIPDKMEFRGAKSATGCKFRQDGRDIIFEPLPKLAPRADAIYRVVVRGMAAGDLRFRARIRADGLTEPVLREESTKVYAD